MRNYLYNLSMHLYLKYLIISILSLIFISCGTRNDQGLDSISDDSLATDTVEADPWMKFKDTRAVLDYIRESSDSKKYEEGIIPQMAYDVKDYAEKLLNNKHDKFLIVDKAKMKVFLYDKYGRKIKSYGMACSKNYGTKHKRGDNCTAEGFFSVKGIYDSSEWLYTDDFGETSEEKGQFGPRFIRINVPNTNSIGIHGTAAPWSIGGRRSHGCIRLTNDDILELAPQMEVGVPIIISPGPKDMAFNEYMGCYVPSVSTEPGSPRAVAASHVPSNYYPLEHCYRPSAPARHSAPDSKSKSDSIAPSAATSQSSESPELESSENL